MASQEVLMASQEVLMASQEVLMARISEQPCVAQGGARFEELCAALAAFRRLYHDAVC